MPITQRQADKAVKSYLQKQGTMADDKTSIKIRLKKNACPFEDIKQVLDAVLPMVKTLDNPGLYNHKITFRGEYTVHVEFTRKP